MPTPLHLKPPVAAWIVRERKRLKLKTAEVAARLNAMGYPDVKEGTVKVWESNAGRRPGPDNLEGLERLFGSQAPTTSAPTAGTDLDPLVSALQAQTKAIGDLVVRLDGRVVGIAEVKSSYGEDRDAKRGDAAARRRYWLRRARERLDMNRDEIDRTLQLDKGQYGRWEDGVSSPRGRQLARLAELFRIPLDILEHPPATDDERLEAWQKDGIREVTQRRAG